MDTKAHFAVDPAVKSLRRCRKVLAFVGGAPGNQSPNGISALNPDLEAKEWARQQANPMGGELTGPICQVQMSETVGGMCVAFSMQLRCGTHMRRPWLKYRIGLPAIAYQSR